MIADFGAELPQELFLVLEKLGVVFVVHEFFELKVLQRAYDPHTKLLNFLL